MVRESNQNVFLFQIDASSFAEFEISEFDVSRVDCINYYFLCHGVVVPFFCLLITVGVYISGQLMIEIIFCPMRSSYFSN